ncbi:MAG: elongation factor P [Anaerolineales bacterium]|nr:elongation factor P [Anaerolineales bacterium]
MIDSNELRKGVTFELDGNLYKVLDYHHNKPGRGNATIRIKARNLLTGANIEKTFSSGDRIQDIRLDYHHVQFLYSDGELFHFMDNETYEQPAISVEAIGESASYLTEGLDVKLTFYDGKAIDIELPTSVELEVVEAGIAVRGDTATGVTKKVKTQTGLDVQVPNFVEQGDVIKVDTRTGEYLTRV